jgi:FkbM family methyltransferase
MNWQRIQGKLFSCWQILNGKLYASGSQAGEDQLVRYLFYSCLGIDKPSYLDIGANHPFECNNSYFFYARGSKGVCMEPDPSFYSLLKKYRKRDTVLQAGVGLQTSAEANLYVFPGKCAGWNTFSPEEAAIRVKESGINYTQVIKTPLININEVIATYFEKTPNFISLDVEGLDLQILKSLDFERHKPEVICVESITFSVSNQETKISEIADFMQSKGYFAFGDTHVNTIYCLQEAFNSIKR